MRIATLMRLRGRLWSSDMTLDDTLQDQLMAMAAHRYCLGRSSYIVGECVRWVRAIWPQLTDKTKDRIMRDTCDALIMRVAGDERIDAPEWRALVDWMRERMSAEAVADVRRQLAWRGADLVAEVLP